MLSTAKQIITRVFGNLSEKETQNQENIKRLKRGLNNYIVSKKVQSYEYVAPHKLSDEEKRGILETTFSLGNKVFFDASKEDIKPNFKHSYTPRFIVLDSSVQALADNIDSFSIGVNLKA